MPVSVKSVELQLEKILTSRVFLTTELLSRFLRFVVDQSLAGRAAWLKESVLGVEIFGRGSAFDPRMDPVVRVDARRLRTKLTEYYEDEGRFDPVVIAVPKGGYSAVFTENAAVQTSRRGIQPGRASVAVLPFQTFSDAPGFEYFSDGLTEEVIEALSQVAGLHVVGRSAASRYQGKAQDLRKVGAELNVRTVLEGSVRKVANYVRIGSQLIDAATCFHLWSETWEREITDIFALQKEIAGAIASRLGMFIHNGE